MSGRLRQWRVGRRIARHVVQAAPTIPARSCRTGFFRIARGPPPLRKMTRRFFEMNAYDIQARIADEGRVPLVPLVHVHELREGGVVVRDDQITVSATLVHHPPVAPAFAYRFDADDRSIVIS